MEVGEQELDKGPMEVGEQELDKGPMGEAVNHNLHRMAARARAKFKTNISLGIWYV